MDLVKILHNYIVSLYGGAGAWRSKENSDDSALSSINPCFNVTQQIRFRR